MSVEGSESGEGGRGDGLHKPAHLVLSAMGTFRACPGQFQPFQPFQQSPCHTQSPRSEVTESRPPDRVTVISSRNGVPTRLPGEGGPLHLPLLDSLWGTRFLASCLCVRSPVSPPGCDADSPAFAAAAGPGHLQRRPGGDPDAHPQDGGRERSGRPRWAPAWPLNPSPPTPPAPGPPG